MHLEEKLIVNVALTGMVLTKADNPHVPVTPTEIAADVRRCFDAGASIFHVHARDEEGHPTYRGEDYAAVVEAILAAVPDPEIIICLTTSGRTHNTFEKRSEVLGLRDNLKPDMASLTLGSMNFPKQASVNAPDMIAGLAGRMREEGIVPELEAFELGMVEYVHFLISRDILRPPYYFNLLLGSLGSLRATPMNLAMMVQALPHGAVWAGAGIGRFQFQVNALAMAMGGHVRVGIEDAIYMGADKSDLATNPRLVERLVKLGRAMGREPATPEETRRMIGLPARQRTPHADSEKVQSAA